MIKIRFETIGYIIIGFSILLLLTLIFVKRNVDAQGALLCEKFSETGEMEQCPVHKTNTSWLLVSAFGVGFLLLGIGLYLVFMPPQEKEEKKEFKKINLAELAEEEKKIYELIKGKGGSAYQSDILQETGWSKVKVTRILDKMELKEIIERKRRGMTNIVVLK